jgi:putative transposase
MVSPLWYNDKIKELNKQIWIPDQKFVAKNDNILRKFKSKIINFSSFKNTTMNKFNFKFNKISMEDNKLKYNQTINRFKDDILANCNASIQCFKYYNTYVTNKYGTLNPSNINEYQNDNIIKTLKETSLKLNKFHTEYNEMMKTYEEIANLNENKLEFKNFNINNYKMQYDSIHETYYSKCIEKCENITEYSNQLQIYFTKRYNILTYENINEYVNDETIIRINDIIDKFKGPPTYEYVNKNFNKSIESINTEIRSYKIKVKFDKAQSKIIFGWMNSAEFLYNYCVKLYNNDKHFPKNFFSAKSYVFKKLYAKEKRAPYDVLGYVVKVFFDNLSSNYSSIKNGTKKHFTMNPINFRKNRTITIIKNCIGNKGIYASRLGENNSKIDSKKIASDCKLSYNVATKNFYLYAPQYIVCKPSTKNKKPICAIDPGEKIFATYYSLDDYGFIGDNVRPSLLKIQERIKKYQRLMVQKMVNGKLINRKNKKGNPINRTKLAKRIQLLYDKIKGIINELHKKTAHYLCNNYNIILIPEFGTSGMVSDKVVSRQYFKKTITSIKAQNNEDPLKLKEALKVYKKRNRLNSRVKFVLTHQSHYKFKQHLFNKCKEYGCKFIEVTEEYTSQLCVMCGNTDKTFIGRIKKCKHCNYSIHRDVNGARNILLKNILPVLLNQG